MPKASSQNKGEGITREGLLSSPWPGFTVPRYTQVPDEVFDVLMPILTEAEFKCLCYICRRTFGFRKDTDAISLNQMSEGIRTRDGKVIDRGTGLGKTSVKRALAFLIKGGIVHAQKRISEERGYETNVYSLHVLPAAQPGSANPIRRTADPPSPPEGGHNLSHPRADLAPGVGPNPSHPRTDSALGVGHNLPPQEIDTINTVNNNFSDVVVNHTYKGKAALRASLVDLGLSKPVASRLVSQYGTEPITRVVEYVLYRLSRGWQPRESLPAWLVSAITQGWEIPSWFRTPAELKDEKALHTRSQQQRFQRLEDERRREEAEMMKQRTHVLRSLGITKRTDLLWTKINQWLQERNLWRPALTTAILGSISEDRAVVLCGYPFSLEMVKESADAMRDAVAALTGRVVELEVRLEQKLFVAKE